MRDACGFLLARVRRSEEERDAVAMVAFLYGTKWKRVAKYGCRQLALELDVSIPRRSLHRRYMASRFFVPQGEANSPLSRVQPACFLGTHGCATSEHAHATHQQRHVERFNCAWHRIPIPSAGKPLRNHSKCIRQHSSSGVNCRPPSCRPTTAVATRTRPFAGFALALSPARSLIDRVCDG